MVYDFAKHDGERQTPKLAIYSNHNYYLPIPNSRLLYAAIKQRMHLDIYSIALNRQVIVTSHS